MDSDTTEGADIEELDTDDDEDVDIGFQIPPPENPREESTEKFTNNRRASTRHPPLGSRCYHAAALQDRRLMETTFSSTDGGELPSFFEGGKIGSRDTGYGHHEITL